MATDDVWVIVPVFNEAGSVGSVVSMLRATFDHVVCIDDGSRDGSVAEAEAAGAVVLQHAINLGQGAALQTGFDYVLQHTDAAYVVTFDSDGQHQVRDAERMVAEARRTSVDIVLASRFRGAAHDMPWMRGLVLRAGIWFTRWSAGLDVTDTHNGLRVLRRTAVERIRLQQPRMAHASELLNAIVPAGLSYQEEPVEVFYTEHSRTKGQGSINAVNILFDLAAQRIRVAR